MPDVIGHWKILSKPYARRMGNGISIMHVRARCRCGKRREVSLPNLLSGKSKSCGCFRRAFTGKYKMRHGHARKGKVTSLYGIWQAMLRRCETPTNVGYPNYGGRGIVVCEAWHTFENFLKDMGKRPSRFHSLDRIDVNGEYCKKNCRWATAKEQRSNQRLRARLDQFTPEELLGELVRRKVLPAGYENVLRRQQHN